eukprot:1183642-Prorocentrum_minimum.AAC.1
MGGIEATPCVGRGRFPVAVVRAVIRLLSLFIAVYRCLALFSAVLVATACRRRGNGDLTVGVLVPLVTAVVVAVAVRGTTLARERLAGLLTTPRTRRPSQTPTKQKPTCGASPRNASDWSSWLATVATWDSSAAAVAVRTATCDLSSASVAAAASKGLVSGVAVTGSAVVAGTSAGTSSAGVPAAAPAVAM